MTTFVSKSRLKEAERDIERLYKVLRIVFRCLEQGATEQAFKMVDEALNGPRP